MDNVKLFDLLTRTLILVIKYASIKGIVITQLQIMVDTSFTSLIQARCLRPVWNYLLKFIAVAIFSWESQPKSSARARAQNAFTCRHCARTNSR